MATMTGSHLTALGLMSAASMSGIEAAIVETDGLAGARTGPWVSVPYDPTLRRRLATVVADADRATANQLITLTRDITDAHAAAVETFLARRFIDPGRIDVVGFHGHTVSHRPEAGITRQIGDGARLAERLGIDVVTDFRSADVAAGGRGEPLAPLFLAALTQGLPRPIAVLDLGAVGTITFVDGETILAFDAGPANAPIDAWVARHAKQPFDAGGQLAAAGMVQEEALATLLDHPYFDAAPPKWVDLSAIPTDPVAALAPADGAATLTMFAVEAVVRAVEHLPAPPVRWLVAGGGRHNGMMMALLRARLGMPVDPVEAAGWQGDALAAQTVGYLAVRSLKGLPLSLPTTTGAPLPIRGGVVHRRPKVTEATP